MASPAVAEEVDGRRLRKTNNREAVLDALVELFGESNYQPGSNEIAARAGISPRSLFRYFDDVDDLVRAAIERQLAVLRTRSRLDIDPTLATGVKIARVVEARVRLFEAIAPTARAARVCAHRHPMIAERLRTVRAGLREQVRDVFAPELAARGGAALPALDVLCSFETHELLRVDQRLSRAKTVAALSDALRAVLAGPHS